MNWDNKTCDFCGIGHRAYIVILLDLPDPQCPPEFAYSETALCLMHWQEIGIKAAFEHNRELRDIAGIEHEVAK